MYKIIQGKTHSLKDIKHFIEIINSLDRQPHQHTRELFNKEHEIIISRAPGRLDVMGGIADYSGSLVLQLPIMESTITAVQQSMDRSIRIVSLTENESDRQNYFNMSIDDFYNNGRAIEYKTAQQYFNKNKSTRWAAYVAGAFLVLIKEKSISFENGANILIHSNIPEGKGVSSSAALEVATMYSIIRAFSISINSHELALLCQKVENLIVGAPCGIMDQMTSMFSKKNQLLALLCQPAELKSYIIIPEEIIFWGIDSGIKHSVAERDYTSVRVGAFMGQRIISELINQNTDDDYPTFKSKYLVNVTPSLYEKFFIEKIPKQLKGSEFIQHYYYTIDNVTEIDSQLIYNISNPTAHPIYEYNRVKTFSQLLSKPLTEIDCINLGELMYQSHQSYSACGLGSTGTDWLVDITKAFGALKGIYGARVTGGGSGGTVAILSRRGSESLIEKIAEKYSEETGITPYIFSHSSMGAKEFGNLILKTV